MGPIRAVTQAFRRATDFKGRSQRSAYWWFALFFTVIQIGLEFVDQAIGIILFNGNGLLGQIAAVILVLPDCAVGMRRLHDSGLPGWIYLIFAAFSYGFIFLPLDAFDNPEDPLAIITMGLIVLVAFIALMLVMIVLLLRDSQTGPNRYGPNPKGIGNVDVFN